MVTKSSAYCLPDHLSSSALIIEPAVIPIGAHDDRHVRSHFPGLVSGRFADHTKALGVQDMSMHLEEVVRRVKQFLAVDDCNRGCRHQLEAGGQACD